MNTYVYASGGFTIRTNGLFDFVRDERTRRFPNQVPNRFPMVPTRGPNSVPNVALNSGFNSGPTSDPKPDPKPLCSFLFCPPARTCIFLRFRDGGRLFFWFPSGQPRRWRKGGAGGGGIVSCERRKLTYFIPVHINTSGIISSV